MYVTMLLCGGVTPLSLFLSPPLSLFLSCPPSIPDAQDVSFAEIKIGTMCLDTLGYQAGGAVGVFQCHGGGGNQVGLYALYTHNYT